MKRTKRTKRTKRAKPQLPTPQDRRAQKRAARAWKGLVDTTLPLDIPLNKHYDFKGGKRGRSAKKLSALNGRGVQIMHPRIVNVSFDVSQEVAAALRALRDTGLYGNGVDCASIAEELLRKALLDPTILPHWRKP